MIFTTNIINIASSGREMFGVMVLTEFKNYVIVDANRTVVVLFQFVFMVLGISYLNVIINFSEISRKYQSQIPLLLQ